MTNKTYGGHTADELRALHKAADLRCEDEDCGACRDFFEAAHNALPELLAEVERLEQELLEASEG